MHRFLPKTLLQRPTRRDVLPATARSQAVQDERARVRTAAAPGNGAGARARCPWGGALTGGAAAGARTCSRVRAAAEPSSGADAVLASRLRRPGSSRGDGGGSSSGSGASSSPGARARWRCSRAGPLAHTHAGRSHTPTGRTEAPAT